MSEFNDLECGLVNDRVVKERISLVFGDYICKNCASEVQKARIKCKICSVETDESNLQMNKESRPIKIMRLSNLSELFEKLEKRATNEINTFKSKIFLLIEWF